jgi:hypothetical protein
MLFISQLYLLIEKNHKKYPLLIAEVLGAGKETLTPDLFLGKEAL